jgi:DNA-binding CsgD family transcriptional regulator
MTTPTDESGLTDRQRDVLRLVREGRNPTEIGRELGISSQGVHGHLRRLRDRGLVEAAAPAKPAARKRSANDRQPHAAAGFDPKSAIAAVQQAIVEQREQLDTREAEIDAQITQLRDEKKLITATRKELEKLTPGVSSEKT